MSIKKNKITIELKNIPEEDFDDILNEFEKLARNNDIQFSMGVKMRDPDAFETYDERRDRFGDEILRRIKNKDFNIDLTDFI